MTQRFAFLILTLLLGLPVRSTAQSKFIMSTRVMDAYQDITSLKLAIGQLKLNEAKISESNNAMVYYIENYIDFFTLFIQEDYNSYKKLLANRDKRLEKIKLGDPNSPYYLFCQAEIILQWATIKLKFDKKISAASDVYSAYKLLEENKQRFPNFVENNKSLSIIHALAESVPSWVRNLMGIKGSVAVGTREIEELVQYSVKTNSIFKNEIIAIYSYILFYSNNRKEDAFRLYNEYKLDHRKNPLIAFLKSTMAHNTGRNDLAIKILEERPSGSQYLPFYYLDFIYGKYKLYRLDRDAKSYLIKFIDNFTGQHYIKEAYQKLAWYSLIIDNDVNSFQKYMKSCSLYGSKLIDEDIQAYNEARSEQVPDPILLKARVLFDGGYYFKAKQLLEQNTTKYTNSINDGEFYYRMARILDALKSNNEALKFYDITIKRSDPSRYYACSAALNAGLIYEQAKNYKKARVYFNLCLNSNPEGYSSSLHQKAKSGLDRIKNK